MSHEVKRVSVDFDWPLNKVWKGYVQPESQRCQFCDGSGQTHFGWWLQKFSLSLGLLACDIVAQYQENELHRFLSELPNAHGHFTKSPSGIGKFVVDRPTPDALDFFATLMGVPKEKIGPGLNDARPYDAVMIKLLEVTGMDVNCKECGGEGERVDAEEIPWKPTDPPAGDGWQLWSTISEGTPVSPVFPTSDELVAWMTFPDRDIDFTREAARNLIENGWAPTMRTTGR